MENNEKGINYITLFRGNVSGIQIQQGTVNSSQSFTQMFDYEEVANILDQIKKYEPFFDDEYGEKASELRNKIDEIDCMLQKKESPNKIRVLLEDIKNLSTNVAGSLIASGIVTLLSRM